jgi:hypothetical protein
VTLRVYASFAEFERDECDRAGREEPAVPSSSCPTTPADANLAVTSQAVLTARAPSTTACPAKLSSGYETARSASLRVYASFAEFEHDERCCLPEPSNVVMNHALSPRALSVTNPAPPPRVALSKPKRVQSKDPLGLTPAAIRAEGVLEIGRVAGTSVLYVRTRVRLCLMHQTWLSDRRLDDYAVRLAVNWLENHGLPSYEVAGNLGVNETTLRQALLEAGYERALPARPKMNARLKIGNRRGRFMRRGTTLELQAAQPQRMRAKKPPPDATWSP